MPAHEPSSRCDHESLVDSVLSANPSFLTPPLSTDGLDRPPFKPLDADKVSLSMNKSSQSAKQRRRLNRACASSGDANAERKRAAQAEHYLSRKSLPDLNKYKRPFPHPLISELGNSAWVDQHLQKLFSERGRGSSNAFSFDSGERSELARRPRRWTVPSKSRPTHLVCFTNHTPTASNNKLTSEKSSVTPAMIVLRRATTKKERASLVAQSNITFFPPPKFSRTSMPLLSFLRISSQKSPEPVGCLNTNASMTQSSGQSLVPSPPRRPSVTIECAQPSCSVTAEPAVTDVIVYSAREHDTPYQIDGSGHRRFSTKIVSYCGVHEIIWDENVISSASNSSSSNTSRKATADKKRKCSSNQGKASIAVEKLETQLRRDSSGPRRGLPENPSGLHRIHQKSFQSLLNFKFGEVMPKAGDLRALPRSRASVPSVAPSANNKIFPNPRRKMQHAGLYNDIEFFPPLRFQASGMSFEHPATLEHSPVPDDTLYHKRKLSMGRSLGQSRHVRRRSAANYYHYLEKPKGLGRPSEDHMPLVGETGLDGTRGNAIT